MTITTMDLLGQSALILSVVSFVLALAALSRNLQNKLVLSFVSVCAVVSAWAFFFFLEKIFPAQAFYQFHLVLNLMLSPVCLFFIRFLTRMNTTFHVWLFRGSIIYAGTVFGLLWTGWGESPVVKNLTYFSPSFVLIECIYLMIRGPRRRWIYVGALVVLCMCTMDHIQKLGDVLPSIGNILLCLYLFFISEAVIHQRLLNLGALTHKVLVFLFISMCFTIVYIIFVAWIDASPALFFLNSFIASFLILMLVDPVRRLTSFGAFRLLSRKYLVLDQEIRHAQAQLTGVLDTMGLAQLMLQFLENALKFRSATVFLLRSDETKFRRIRGIRDDQSATREILSNHPLVEFFGKLKRRAEAPVLLDHYIENELDRSTSQVGRQSCELILQALHGLNANIVIPFIDQQKVLGFVAIHAPNLPEPWRNNWGLLSAIYPLFVQATRVLKDLDVYVRQREKDRLATLGEMAAGLAHEIRNPLGAIKGAAQILETQELNLVNQSQDPTAFLKIIIEEVNRLNKVVTQFLEYSRPHPAPTELSHQDVTSILERTHVLFQKTLPQDNIRMELIAPEGGFSTLPTVQCRPEQIKQVLVNLVQNSVQSLKKFPPSDREGQIRMGAKLEGSAEHRRNLVLYVEDNGMGISRENTEKIFIPFFTTTPGGTGLGLPICARIIETHGGRIDVISEEGKWTRFSVYLPVATKEI